MMSWCAAVFSKSGRHWRCPAERPSEKHGTIRPWQQCVHVPGLPIPSVSSIAVFLPDRTKGNLVWRFQPGLEPTRRRIVFSIALFPIAATLFLFRLTKSRRTFYAQIECLCFHTASVDCGGFSEARRWHLRVQRTLRSPFMLRPRCRTSTSTIWKDGLWPRLLLNIRSAALDEYGLH